MSDIRGLTLWRPWSWCISHSTKRVENRDWPAPRWALGRYLAIHAGKTYDVQAARTLADEFGVMAPPPATCPQGIVAVARLAACVTEAPAGQEDWFSGPYGWQLDQVVALEPAVPCRGAQGLWPVPLAVLELVRERWTEARRRQGRDHAA